MKNLPATNFQILEPHEFLEDVKLEAHTAKERIWAQAMDVVPGVLTNQLLGTLEKKAKEGLDARLHVDYYSLLVTEGAFNYYMSVNRKFEKEQGHKITGRKLYFNRLEENGVKILYTNPPGILETLFPFKGRNHMKIVVVDDKAWIGGINFNDENLNGNDFMIKLTDERIVTPITKLYQKIDKKELFNDYEIKCTPETTLLVDSGKIGRSIILDNALDLIAQAKSSVFMTTAFFPDTKMIKLLHRLHKNKGEVKVVAPAPSSMSGIYKYVENFNILLTKVRHQEFQTKMMTSHHHAKLLVVDRQYGMFGSHNFSGRGVNMGTGEVAIKTTNPFLINELLEFVAKTHLKP